MIDSESRPPHSPYMGLMTPTFGTSEQKPNLGRHARDLLSGESCTKCRHAAKYRGQLNLY